MSNKLTSLTGFGEGDPKPERTVRKSGRQERKVIPYRNDYNGYGAGKPSRNKESAKSSALNKKMGKSDKLSADMKKNPGKYVHAPTRSSGSGHSGHGHY